MPSLGLLSSRYMSFLKLINEQNGVPCEALPDAFFPEDIVDPNLRSASTKMAKAMCKTCPIIEACFTYALETNQRHGIWGGTAPDDR